MRNTNKLAVVVAIMAALSVLFGGMALADEVHNNIATDLHGARVITITAGDSATADFWIAQQPANQDGQAGCNAADGSAAVLSFSHDAAVTANPSSLTFTACGGNDKQAVSFSANVPGTYAVTGSVTDAGAGSYGNTTFTVQVNAAAIADTIAPVITVPANQAATATSTDGAEVSFDAPTIADETDPNPSLVCVSSPTAGLVSGDTFPLGVTTITCNGADASGNDAAEAAFTVAVTYAWSGVLQPINRNGSSVFKLGSTIPVKFTLSGSSASITDAVATLATTRTNVVPEGTVTEAVSTAAATTGSLFRYADGQYVFNLSTKSLTHGTYNLSIDLGDGVDRIVEISLKK